MEDENGKKAAHLGIALKIGGISRGVSASAKTIMDILQYIVTYVSVSASSEIPESLFIY